MIAIRTAARSSFAAVALATALALTMTACPSGPQPTSRWQSAGGDKVLPDWLALEEFNVVEENGQSRTMVVVRAKGPDTIQLGYAIRYVNDSGALMPIYSADPDTPDDWPQTIELAPGASATLRATSAPPTERNRDVGGVRVQFWNASTGDYIGGTSRDW